MDVELLVAGLLMRGFTHREDDDKGRSMYVKGGTAVVIRGNRAVIGTEFYVTSDAFEFVDHILALKDDQT